MKNLYANFLKGLSIFAVAALAGNVVAQIPSVLRSQIAGGTSVNYNLNDFGRFRQVRIQASGGAPAGRTWAFGTGTAVSPSFTRNWRPAGGTGSQIQLPGFNQLVIPASGNPPAYGSATTNGSGAGTDGTLPAVTASRFYTFNITENSTAGTPVNENMSVIETGFNPVAITSVTANTGSPSANNSVLVTVNTASAPAAGELLYVRYSTNASFTTSDVVAVTMSGNTGTAILPCQSAGTTVYYYAFSTNKTSAQLAADVVTAGQSAYEMATLQIDNNSASNYSYTVVSGSGFSGVYGIPSSCYPTLNSFVSALNASAVTGPVDVYLERGHRETAPSLGINLNATGTVTNPIRFLSRGSGPKPLINAGVGTVTMSSGSTTVDYILGIHGGDFITIDGINFADSNTTGAAQMEAGIMVFRASTVNASQNVTISGCRVWFRNPVMSVGPTLFENGNKGIAFVGAVNNALTTTTVPASSAGRCENNILEADTILNAYTGILVRSSDDGGAPFNFIDQNTTIGGSTDPKGCVVTGFVETGIKTYNQNNLVVRNNRINNNSQIGYTGMPAGTTVNGIWLNGQTNNNAFIICSNNTITARNPNITGTTVFGIRSESVNGGPESRQRINDNTITGLYNLFGSVNGIVATAFCNRGLQVMRNTISGGRCAGTVSTDRFTGISAGNSSGGAELTQVRENAIFRDTASQAFTGINFVSSSGWNYFKGYQISRNIIGSQNLNDGIIIRNIGGSSYGINNSSSARYYIVDSNIIAGYTFESGTTGTSTNWGYYENGSPSLGLRYIRGNVISKIDGPNTASASNSFIGVQYGTGSSDNLVFTNNTISNINGFASIRGGYFGWGFDYGQISDNLFDSLYTSNSTVGTLASGLDYSFSASGDSILIFNNICRRIVTSSSSTTSASIATGLNIAPSSGVKVYAYNNTISDISNQSSNGYARGINVSGASAMVWLWNNRAGNISAPANSTSLLSAVGIELNAAGSSPAASRIFNNTVYLNAAGSATSFSTAALLISGSTYTADIYNNIFYNTSTPGSDPNAFTAAIWQSTTGAPGTGAYTTRSNNNLFYTNPLVNPKYPVYRNSSSAFTDASLCDFVTRLTAPRELNSVQAPVSFLSVSGSSPNYLLVDPATPTFAEGGGYSRADFQIPDVQGQTRNFLTPDIGADEFNGSVSSTSSATVSATVNHPTTVAVTPGTRDAVILGTAITLSSFSSTAPANISRIRFNTLGTTNASTSIDTAKLWYSQSNTSLSNAILVGTVVNPNGGFAFNLTERVACAGTMNFIVTYGVKCPGAGTFVLDCQLDTVYVSGVGTFISTGAPALNRSISTLGAGMTGLYTVGGATPNYPTLTAAINDVNTRGLAGPVVLEVRNGHTERAPGGAGIVLDVNPPVACGATRPNKVNTLTIRRASGPGNRPIIYSGTGVASPTSTTPDGIFKINGEDYVTINGLSFVDTSLNTTTTTRSEFGIMISKRNNNDASKRIVITNCLIRLNRLNVGASFNNRMGGGATGILVTNVTGTGTTTLTPTLPSGTVDSVFIGFNTITNVYHPIIWYGIENSDRNYAWKDNRDSIVGNVMNNFGGSTIETNGIMMLGVNNYVISGNVIDNKANGGVDHTQTGGSMFGIRIGTGSANTTTAENFSGGVITNNTIIWNHAPASALSPSPHGAIGVYAGGRNQNLTVTGNRFINSVFSANSSGGSLYGVYLNTAAHFNRLDISRNRMSDISMGANKTVIGYFTSSSVAKTKIFDRDTFFNITNTATSGTGQCYGIQTWNTSTTPGLIDSSITITNNIVRNINFNKSVTSAGDFYGINTQTSGYANCTVNNNLIRNAKGVGISSTNSGVIGILVSGGNVVTMQGNTVDSIATVSLYTNCSTWGIASLSADTLIQNQNTVTRIYNNSSALSTTVNMYGIVSQSFKYAEITQNKVADISASTTPTVTAHGVNVYSEFGSLIHNNIIGDVVASQLNSTTSYLSGLMVFGGGIHRIYHNTVYLNTTSAGAEFNSAALYFGATNGSNPTGRYSISNNIFYNTSTAKGSGRTVAFQKAFAFDQTLYNTASNNNLLYAGVPSTANLIYRNVSDGSFDQTMCDFLNRSVLQGGGVRDAYSVSSILNFSSLAPTSSGYLHINPTIPSLVEGNGTFILGIDRDFDGDIRSLTTPDIGADEGAFTPVVSTPTVTPTVTQIPGGVSQGATNVPILRVELNVASAAKTLNLTNIQFNTAGTTNPPIDIDSAKVFFTGTSNVFSNNATRFGSSIANPNGSISFTGNVPVYCNGSFYLWLVYDVKCGNGGDVLDAQAVDLTLGGTTYSMTPANPAGNRLISAPMSGTFTVGGTTPDYATLAAALSDINLKGLSGPVTLDVRAGHLEAAPVGGLQLYINSSCPGYRSSKARPIVIRKSGTGANPKIVSFAGTSTLASPSPDGIFKIVGEDWVTIDGIDLEDTSTINSNTHVMEWGYALLNSSESDGCKRVVIRNAAIRMSKNQRQSGGIPVGTSGSKGILVSTILPTSITPLTLTSTSGSHDSCLFSNLTIQRCQSGIVIAGYNDPTPPFALLNQRDSIVNCRITNFGANDPAFPLGANGMRIWETNNTFISGNLIDNRADGGVANNAQILGIAVNPTGTNSNVITKIQRNVVSVAHTSGIGIVVVSGIYAAVGGSGSRAEITDNKVWRSSGTGISNTATWYGIWATGTPGYVLVQRDTVQNDTFSATMYSLFCNGAVTADIMDNEISGERAFAAVSHFGIYTNALTNALIRNNTLRNIIMGTVTAGQSYGIYSLGSGENYRAINNTLRDIKAGTFRYGIYAPPVSVSGRVSNNLISGNLTGTASNSTNYHIYVPGAAGTGQYFIDSNTVENDTLLSGIIRGFELALTTGNTGNIRNNIWRNSISISTSSHTAIAATGSALRNLNITNNLLTNDTFGSGGATVGLISAGVNGTMNFNNNLVIGCRFGGSFTGVNATGTGRFFNYNFNSFRNNTFNNMLNGISVAGNQRYKQLIGDTFINNSWRGATTGTFTNFRIASTTPSDTSVRVEGNVVRNLRLGNTGINYQGIWNYSSANSTLTERYVRNEFSDILLSGSNTGTGFICGVFNGNGSSSASARFIDSNSFHNLNTQGTGIVYACSTSYNYGPGTWFRGNRIDSLISGGTVGGIIMESSSNKPYTIIKNKISDLIIHGTAGTAPVIYGIRCLAFDGGTKLFASNNLIANLNAPANSIGTLRGISVENASSLDTAFIDHNTILLSANTTGTNLSATGIFASTTPNLLLRNNLVDNGSTPKGTGRVIAFQRSSSSIATYLASSNGNSFFAGTPGVNNLVYADGTNNSQTLSDYKTLVGATLDAQSVSADADFLSSVFASNNFLRLRVFEQANCALNKGGVPVSLVTDDYWNTTRSTTTPDIGAHEFDNTNSILLNPVDTTICPGGNASFDGATTAGISANYRWFKNGIALNNGGVFSGAATPILQITGAALSDSGNYTLKIWLCGNDTLTTNVATLRVLRPSDPATSVSSSLTDTICVGRTTTLTPNGGFRGAGAVWKWYTGGCGTTLLSTGNSVNVAPATSTTYFLRAEGTCNTTACASINIVVQDTSVPAVSITGNNTICLGTSTTLSVSGGSLGQAASWRWYSGTCGGTVVGTGSSITVSPTSAGTITYFVRAEGKCNNTICRSYTVTVRDTSRPAVSITGTTTICLGQSTTLSVNGGSLGHAAGWRWYSGSCGGTAAGNGINSNVISPTSAGTYSYFVRAEGTCNNTICRTVNVTVRDSSIPATSITGVSTICLGTSTTLSVSGGSLGHNANWVWYSGSCAGTSLGTGSSVTVAPAVNTTYFVRAEGTCNNTICRSVVVTVRDSSLPATSISATSTTICLGQSATLTRNGGSLGFSASWRWYSNSCGGSSAGTGNSVTVSPATPGTHTYFLRAEGSCNNTICRSITITVRDSSKPATAIIATSDSVCRNASAKLYPQGGSKGHGATWKWYTGPLVPVACGGTLVGTGDTLTVSPSAATRYYLRAEGTCNTTLCVSKIVNTRDTSVRPISITSNIDSGCIGAAVSLSINGGTLGTGASWKWYDGNCGGTAIATGSTFNYNINVTRTLFVRAEGICNTTLCASKVIRLRTTSSPATSITVSKSTICNGETVTLTRNGGVLGSGGSWKWYNTGCATGLAGTGNTITVSPSQTTTYWVRAEDNCGASACLSTTITVRDTSVPATSINGPAAPVCLGSSNTISVNGGFLGTGASWRWYTGSCGGTLLNSGASITVNPANAGTNTYFVRAEGICNNTICRTITITTRDTSIKPTSITGPTLVCQRAQPMVFKINGGLLSQGAAWNWYRIACGGPGIPWTGSGDSITLTTSQLSVGTHTLYVRAQGGCNTTPCVTHTFTIRDTSVPASSISGTAATICLGQSSTLNINGGSLGNGASWRWYVGNCGGTSIQTGTTLTVSPTAAGTFTYFVRAEGTCNNTICRSFTITVRDTSVPATSISGTTNLCLGQSTTLSRVGGSLGHNATWKWYEGTCGTGPSTNGNSITVTPSAPGTYTYSLRAEGTCNYTACRTVTVTVNDTSIAPASISGTAAIVCRGQSSTMTINGGKLGTGASWRWYLGGCGGTSVGSGSSLTVTPSTPGTFTYFARAEGSCNNTPCASFTLTMRDTSVPATSISATSTILCGGQSSTLTINGGSLGHNASWRWYLNSCGGTSIASGTSLTVSPNVAGSYTYFARAEGSCNTTICRSVTITVRDTSVPATSINGSSSICQGGSTTLTLNGGSLGTGASWRWYTGSCGGTLVSSGATLTVSPSAGGSYTYFVRAEGTCNNTLCRTFTVVVNDTSRPAVAVLGPDTVCVGRNYTLRVSGGKLGAGAQWNWYRNACGGSGTPWAGNGDSIRTSMPVGVHAYFVNAQGACNTTICASKSVVVVDTSVAPSNQNLGTVCLGSTVNMSVSGGRLGYRARWRWYTGTCGGTLAGTGSGLSVKPSTPGTYTYFVRPEGACNTTACGVVTFTIQDSSKPATSILVPSVVCQSSKPVVFRRVGGNMSSGGKWNWYRGLPPCLVQGSSWLGSGDSLVMTTAALGLGTHTIYLRGEGGCNSTGCISTTITVRDTSVPAAFISGDAAICVGQTTNLKVEGGALGHNGTWKWFSGTCGGATAGTGNQLSFKATTPGTFTYFVRAEGSCNNTVCRSFTITVRDTTKPATSVAATKTTICAGQSTTLSVVGGSLSAGSDWTWHVGSCGGTVIGTGASITVSPAVTSTYFVRASGPCGTSVCASITINATGVPQTPVSITSNYNEVCAGTPVKLWATQPPLQTGETRKWYILSGNNLIPAGSGDTVQINISSTTDVLVRTENSCFNSGGITKRITVLSLGAGNWVGIKSSSWHDAANWCGGVPTASTDVTISSGTPFKPVITATAQARNLVINSGTDVTVNAGGMLELYGSLTKAGGFTSNGTVAYRSSGNVLSDGFNTANLEVNTTARVSLRGDVKVSGTMTLTKGYVITGGNQVHVTNRSGSAVVAGSGNTNFASGWIAGNLRRELQTGIETYNFPVGSVNGGNNIEMNTRNIVGTSTILAYFGVKPGNDNGLNVFENATPYGSVNNGGIWYMIPNDTAVSGNFDLKLYFNGQTAFTNGMTDNGFSILNRSQSSVMASDWKIPATNSQYVAGQVTNGYAQRNNVKAFGQFGIGLTLYPVKVKGTAYSGSVTIQPNPFNAEFAVNMNIPRTAQVTVNVYDQAGRLVAQQNAGKLAGSNSLKVNTGNLSEGTYTVVVKGDGQTLHTEKMVKILK